MKANLLFISPSSPYPPKDGKRQRTLALLDAALQIYSVDFLILGASEREINNLNENNSIPDLKFLFCPIKQDIRWVKKIGISLKPNHQNISTLSKLTKEKSYQKIFCRYAISARDLLKDSNFYLDVDDDYQELMKTKIYSQTSFWKQFRYLQILLVNIFFYKRILKRSKQLIWVRDQKRSGHILPNLPFQILLSGIKELTSPRSGNLLFVGKLSYEPNESGIRWFLLKVWPNLLKANSGIEFTIISSVSPSSDIMELIKNSKGVSLKINVSDLQEHYLNHSICIVPIFSGGGSNVKLPEALLMGRKVITTDFGSRGFENWIKSGEVTLANTPKEWIESIMKTLNDPWQENSWKKIRTHFSLDAWNQKFLEILDES